jgi:hypothetical protein
MKGLYSSLLALAILTLAAAVPARPQEDTGFILERSGEAGGFQLGDKIRSHQSLEKLDNGLYSTSDGGIRLVADGSVITEIQVRARRYFTQKLIRPRESILADVLEVYGEPNRTCSRSGRFSASYGPLEFQTSYELAGKLRKTDLEALLASRIEFVSLRTPQDFKLSFENGVRFYEQGNWQELAAAMERTLCDQPAGDPPKRIRTYGMKFRDYVPHFYLGLAWLELHRCQAALAEWELSETSEGIREIDSKLQQIQQGRRRCASRTEMVSLR